MPTCSPCPKRNSNRRTSKCLHGWPDSLFPSWIHLALCYAPRTNRPTALTGHYWSTCHGPLPDCEFLPFSGSRCPLSLAWGHMHNRPPINNWKNKEGKEQMSKGLVCGQFPPPPGAGAPCPWDDRRELEATRTDHRAPQSPWMRFVPPRIIPESINRDSRTQ